MTTRVTRRGRGWLVAGSLAGALVACGSEEVRSPSGPAMAPAASAPAASRVEAGPPVVERVAIEPAEPLAGGRVRAVVTAVSPDGGAVRLRYAWRLDGVEVGSDAPEVVLEGGRKGQSVALDVVAVGEGGTSAPARASARIGNRPPQLLAVALEPASGVRVGSLVRAVPEGVDPDDDPLRYEVVWLVNGAPAAAKGLELDTARFHRGDRLQAKVRASDGRSTTPEVPSATLEIGNTAPEIVSRPELRFEGETLRYDVEARDADGDRKLRYRLERGPEGMAIDRFDGVLTWTPSHSQAGRHPVSVAVEDSEGATVVQDFEVSVDSERPAPPAAPTPES